MTHHRMITEKELQHFEFIFDKMEAWKKSANNDECPSFVQFWNESIGKELDKMKEFLSDNWLLEDNDIGLVSIKDFKKWREN